MKSIHVDQLGYCTQSIKKAVILTDEPVFNVCLADGTVVYSCKASEPIYSQASDEMVRIADFSEVTQSGEYYISSGTASSICCKKTCCTWHGCRWS